ncbi:MAG: DsrE family protein [Elusimicrobia bacterium]|nr:DsrE family protein [Elusimicrobiota bacterium]
MRRLLFPVLVLIGVLAFGCGKPATPRPSAKFLIILQADTDRHEGLARALHALLYAKELKEGGYPVTLVFDGAGTGWAQALRDPKHKLHAKYADLKKLGVVEEICDFCAGAFKVKAGLKQMSDAALVGEFEGHPSLRKWADQGYQVIVL